MTAADRHPTETPPTGGADPAAPARRREGRSLPTVVWPLLALAAILVVDVIISPSFFSIRLVEGRLYGSLVDIFYRGDRKSTRLNSSHNSESRMPSSA
jgi:hypothetical protein